MDFLNNLKLKLFIRLGSNWFKMIQIIPLPANGEETLTRAIVFSNEKDYEITFKEDDNTRETK